jgi:SRSO17 transposase
VALEAKAGGGESRFAAYVEAITRALEHADRAAPLSYCTGRIAPGEGRLARRGGAGAVRVRVPRIMN